MDTQYLRERFETLTWSQQVGNLASTLAHIAKRAESPKYDKLVLTWLKEVVLLAELAASNVPKDYEIELTAVQQEAKLWQQIWPLEPTRPLLALHTHHQSQRLLYISGLANPEIIH